MAQRNAVRNLQEEATCAVCLDFFRQPVMLLACGHNFCRSCVARCAEKSQDGAGSCPQCRLPFPPGGFCPNRQLANVVAVVRELVEGEQDLCLGGGSRARGADLEHRVPLAEPLEDREPTPSSSTPQEPLGPPQNKMREDERAATLLTPPGGAQQALLVGTSGGREAEAAGGAGGAAGGRGPAGIVATGPPGPPTAGAGGSQGLARRWESLGRRSRPQQEHGAEAAATGARSGARGFLPKKQRPGSGGGEAQRCPGLLPGGRPGGIPKSECHPGPGHRSPPDPGVPGRPQRPAAQNPSGPSSGELGALRGSSLRPGPPGFRCRTAPLGRGGAAGTRLGFGGGSGIRAPQGMLRVEPRAGRLGCRAVVGATEGAHLAQSHLPALGPGAETHRGGPGLRGRAGGFPRRRQRGRDLRLSPRRLRRREAEAPAVVGRRAGPAHFLPLKSPQSLRFHPKRLPTTVSCHSRSARAQ